jgi:acetoin utilization protein AcuB
MSKTTSVEKFMTPLPHTINSSMTLQTAREMMRRFGVRHLPVQEAGHLVGVVTDRDLKLASSFDSREALHVDDVMTPEPYAVPPGMSLGDVVEEMAEHKYGCAVIQNDKGGVVGIFTATDGLRALGDRLKARRASPARKRGAKR